MWELLLHLHCERIYIDLICSKSSFIWPVSVDALTKESFNVFSNRFPFPRHILFATRIQLQFTPQTLTSNGIPSFRSLLQDSPFRVILIQLSRHFSVRKMRYNSDYHSLAIHISLVTIQTTAVTSQWKKAVVSPQSIKNVRTLIDLCSF